MSGLDAAYERAGETEPFDADKDKLVIFRITIAAAGTVLTTSFVASGPIGRRSRTTSRQGTP